MTCMELKKMTEGHLPKPLMYMGNELHLANDFNGQSGRYERWLSRMSKEDALPHPNHPHKIIGVFAYK